MVGHVAPEAADGGPIAALEDGDEVTVDVPNRELSVGVSDDELAARRETWSEPDARYDSGVLRKYGDQFGSAAHGAVTNPAAKRDD
jgi:dihydroxy-acid dehydratase